MITLVIQDIKYHISFYSLFSYNSSLISLTSFFSLPDPALEMKKIQVDSDGEIRVCMNTFF
jgi:hypothetical protein